MKQIPDNYASEFSLVEKPDLQMAKNFLLKSFRRKDFVIIAGNCRCEYSGRASSSLDWGDRITLIKGDGSVQVHRPSGYEPVNWQPPGCIFHSKITEKNVLQVKAVRRSPAEVVEVFFNEVFLVSVLRLRDTGKFFLYASEEDMQKAVISKPSILGEEFKIIAYEKRVEPGFVDVYGLDGEGNFIVVEIKRKTAGRKAVLQLARYVDSVRETVSRPVRGILAAPNISKGVQRMLATLNLEYKVLKPSVCAEVLTRTKTRRLEQFFEQ